MNRSYIIAILVMLSCCCAVAQNVDSQRKTIEDDFIARMKEMSRSDVFAEFIPDTIAMNKIDGKDFYVCTGDKYIIEQISSATYYVRKDGNYYPLCDNRFPAETIANRLLLPNNDLPDGNMKLKFQKYRFETDSISIRLKQFITFCHSEGYKMYIGIEHMDEADIDVDVFLYNNKTQWLHLLSLSCPVNKITEADLSLVGTAWLFVPTSNVRELMGKDLPDNFINRILQKAKDRNI